MEQNVLILQGRNQNGAKHFNLFVCFMDCYMNAQSHISRDPDSLTFPGGAHPAWVDSGCISGHCCDLDTPVNGYNRWLLGRNHDSLPGSPGYGRLSNETDNSGAAARITEMANQMAGRIYFQDKFAAGRVLSLRIA